MKSILIMLMCAVAFGMQAAPRDSEAPDSLLIEKARNGDLEAMNYLGYLLVSGSEGVEPNVEEGLRWITLAAEEGDVKAASNLGWLYIEGEFLQRDLEQGVKWLSKAADAGLPVAKSILGDLYLEGKGLPQDSLAADSLYREAFEGGLGDAGFKLYALNADSYARLAPSEMVEVGKYYYLRSAPSEGVKLFYLAADDGNATAMTLLGDAYTRGIGVPYDHALSLKYYVAGAMAGNPSAQFVLGELLEIFPDALSDNEEWKDVPDDPRYWLDLAAKAGVTDAAIATDRLFK